MQFKIDGKKCSEQAARKAWMARDENGTSDEESDAIFTRAMEQSTDGYVARDWIEQAGITMRHANEEQS